MANSNFVVQNGLTVGSLTIDAATGNISTSGTIVSTSAIPVTLSSLLVTGNLTVNGTTTTVNSTTLDITDINITVAKGATAAAADGGGLTIDGASASLTWDNAATSFKINKSLIPSANVTYNLGSSTAWFNTFFGISTQAKYADLAENYQADKAYNPGTVLMFGGTYEVTLADVNTTAVAGIVSTNPAHLMNGQLSGSNVVPLALTGRVPCMVIGPVKKGDMMVSAGFGYARSSANPSVGQVIGKALEDYPMSTKGVIEVVVGRV
jgi:hypothetical protein